MIKVRSVIPQSNINNLLKERNREKWDGRGSYPLFWENKLKALHSAKIPDSRTPINSKRTSVDPHNDKKRENKARDDDKRERRERRQRRQRRIRRTRPRPRDRGTPQPTPHHNEDNTNSPPATPPRVQPDPPESISYEAPPPPPAREGWSSRVGYFATLSDLKWYEVEPNIVESPFVTLDFEGEPDQFLTLREGQEWLSDWYEQGVIRGINIDVHGTHMLNYVSNGDFEV